MSLKNNDIDKLISDSIEDFDMTKIPIDFTERLGRKFEFRSYKKTLFKEWGAKIMVIIGILISIMGAFYFYSPIKLVEFLKDRNSFFVLLAIVIVLFIFLFDQVLLKILLKKYDKKG